MTPCHSSYYAHDLSRTGRDRVNRMGIALSDGST